MPRPMMLESFWGIETVIVCIVLALSLSDHNNILQEIFYFWYHDMLTQEKKTQNKL